MQIAAPGALAAVLDLLNAPDIDPPDSPIDGADRQQADSPEWRLVGSGLLVLAVPWEFVPSLVGTRDVILHRGRAYICGSRSLIACLRHTFEQASLGPLTLVLNCLQKQRLRASQGLLARILHLHSHSEEQRTGPILAAIRSLAKSLRCTDASRRWITPGVPYISVLRF